MAMPNITALPTTGGLMRVGTRNQVDQAERDQQQEAMDRSTAAAKDTLFRSQLSGYIKKEFDNADNHRRTEEIDEDHLRALRALRGQYDPTKLRDIEQFKGSKVYSRLTAVKCRGASALLRDIYLSHERPWLLRPTPEPVIPDSVMNDVATLVETEVATLEMAGQPIDQTMVQERIKQLTDAARKASRNKAAKEAAVAQQKLDDVLVEGGFYDALDEFIRDLPVFRFACLKGPVVRKATTLEWGQGGQLAVNDKPKMFWYRVNPQDIWLAPGATNARNGPVMERLRLTRDELFDLIGLPGYDEDAIREVLDRAKHSGLPGWRSMFDSDRANLEKRENPNYDDGPYIDALEYHGYVRGELLLDWGMTEQEIPDPDKEYYITAWMVDEILIKVQLNPNPRKEPIYYISSFEKIPGSAYGNGLPDILNDIQEVANATLRALVNNLSIASGPQVIVNTERSAPGADIESLYPWKRWYVTDPVYGGAGGSPVDFFQPQSNAQELLTVYDKFTQMADEVSAIPRYMTGSERVGGAASTASGLSMLMNNSSKVMQSVAANIDNDIIRPVIQQLYDMVMLTDQSGLLRGDEEIEVRGVTTAIQREQDRVRQLEFLQLTGNPIDMQIVGLPGRAAVLRKVAGNLGLDWETIVPSDEELQAMMMAQQQAALEGASQQPGPDGESSDKAQPHLNTQSNQREAT